MKAQEGLTFRCGVVSRDRRPISRPIRTAGSCAPIATSAQSTGRPALTRLRSRALGARLTGSAPGASESAAGIDLPHTK